MMRKVGKILMAVFFLTLSLSMSLSIGQYFRIDDQKMCCLEEQEERTDCQDLAELIEQLLPQAFYIHSAPDDLLVLHCRYFDHKTQLVYQKPNTPPPRMA